MRIVLEADAACLAIVISRLLRQEEGPMTVILDPIDWENLLINYSALYKGRNCREVEVRVDGNLGAWTKPITYTFACDYPNCPCEQPCEIQKEKIGRG